LRLSFVDATRGRVAREWSHRDARSVHGTDADDERDARRARRRVRESSSTTKTMEKLGSSSEVSVDDARRRKALDAVLRAAGFETYVFVGR
jgi:hypothetical protein